MDGESADRYRVAGFEIEQLIARGGSASVFQAADHRHGRKVAVKILDRRGFEEPKRRAFRRELQAMGRLGDHPYVVDVFDSGFTEDGSPYLVMPLIESGTAAARVDRGKAFEVDEVLDLGVKLASALETAHRRGILHCDIKPSNVFLGPFQTPMLGDLGISSVTDTGITTTNRVSLTMRYAAPEIVEDARHSPQSDIYSLGATLFTMLDLAPPYTSESASALAAQILTATEPPAPKRQIPDSFTHLLADMMATDPSDRPASAADVVERLQLIQLERGSTPTPASIDGPASRHESDRASPDDTTADQGKTQPAATGAAGAAAVSDPSLTLAGGAGGFDRPRSTPQPGSGEPAKNMRWLVAGFSVLALVALAAIWMLVRAPSTALETTDGSDVAAVPAGIGSATDPDTDSNTDAEDVDDRGAREETDASADASGDTASGATSDDTSDGTVESGADQIETAEDAEPEPNPGPAEGSADTQEPARADGEGTDPDSPETGARAESAAEPEPNPESTDDDADAEPTEDPESDSDNSDAASADEQGGSIIDGADLVANAITGVVNDRQGPAANLQVNLFVEVDSIRGEYLGNTFTDSAGAYAFDAAPGCYVVNFIASEGSVFAKSGTKYLESIACVDATTKSITNADLITLEEPTSQLSGTVQHSASGSGAADVGVDVFLAGPGGSRATFINSTTTNEQGAYAIMVPPGCYVLTFIAPDGARMSGSSDRYLNSTQICVAAEEGSITDAAVVND